MQIELPVTLPVDFSDSNSGASTITLPLALPMEFNDSMRYYVKLPLTLPMTFDGGKIAIAKLPITLPMSFISQSGIKKTIYITYKEHVDTNKYYGTLLLPYKETAIGKVVKIPFKESGWYFPGLILEENVITTLSSQLTLVENVQALILVDFELVSANMLKLTWYGHIVPSFTIMKKSAIDDQYVESGSYNWNADYAVVEIASEDYNIFLQGSANSGSSAIYTIAGVNDVIVEPDIDVTINDKIYELEIEYTSKYEIVIEY